MLLLISNQPCIQILFFYFTLTKSSLSGTKSSSLQHCDILRRAAEVGGLLVDAMINTSNSSIENSSSVPLMVVENGCGSPCIDLRQVSSELAAAAKDADLVGALDL